MPTSYASFGPASSAPAANARSSRSDALSTRDELGHGEAVPFGSVAPVAVADLAEHVGAGRGPRARVAPCQPQHLAVLGLDLRAADEVLEAQFFRRHAASDDSRSRPEAEFSRHRSDDGWCSHTPESMHCVVRVLLDGVVQRSSVVAGVLCSCLLMCCTRVQATYTHLAA